MEMLVRAPGRRQPRQRLMDIVRGDVKRIDRLITDISDASRLDAELSREATEPVELSHLLETIVEIYRHDRHRAAAWQFALQRRACRRAPRCMGRDERLGQVFRNLIDNAISFSPGTAR